MSALTGTHPRLRIKRKFDWAIPLAVGISVFLISIGFGVKILVALSIATTLTVIFFTDSVFALSAGLFLIYSNLAVVAYREHGVPAPVVSILVVLLFSVPLLASSESREGIRANKLVPLLWMYLVALVASAVFSADPFASTTRIATFIAEGFVLYLIVLNVVCDTRALRIALLTVLLTGAMLATLSLYQKVTGDWDVSFWGLAHSEVIDSETGEMVTPKIAGPIGDRNYYGQILVVLLPIGLFLGWAQKTTARRRMIWSATALIAAAALLTYSRGATVTILFLVALLCIQRYMTTWKALIAGAAVAITLFATSPEYITRMQSLTDTVQSFASSGAPRSTDASIRSRLTENMAAFRLFATHPLLGVGTGQAPDYISAEGNVGGLGRLAGARRGHNMYLEELADNGLLGFGTLALIIIVTIRTSRRESKSTVSHGIRELLTGTRYALYAFLVSAIFLQLAFERYFWLLMALNAAAIEISERQRDTPCLVTSQPK